MTLLEQEDMLKDTFSSVTLWIACQKLCPYVMECWREQSGVSSMKSVVPFMRDLP